MDSLDDIVPAADLEALRRGVGASIARRRRRRSALGASIGVGGALVVGALAFSVVALLRTPVAPPHASEPVAIGTPSPGPTQWEIPEGVPAVGLPVVAGALSTGEYIAGETYYGLCQGLHVRGDHGTEGYLRCGGGLLGPSDAVDIAGWRATHPVRSLVELPVYGATGGRVDTLTLMVPDLTRFDGRCDEVLRSYLSYYYPAKIAGVEPVADLEGALDHLEAHACA